MLFCAGVVCGLGGVCTYLHYLLLVGLRHSVLDGGGRGRLSQQEKELLQIGTERVASFHFIFLFFKKGHNVKIDIILHMKR